MNPKLQQIDIRFENMSREFDKRSLSSFFLFFPPFFLNKLSDIMNSSSNLGEKIFNSRVVRNKYIEISPWEV